MMFSKDEIFKYVLRILKEDRDYYDISNKINHVMNVDEAARKVRLDRNGDNNSNGCVEYYPNSKSELVIFIKQELFDNIEKQQNNGVNGGNEIVNDCYRLLYIETLVHECTHYFELMNYYKQFTNEICFDDENIGVFRQLSEYSATKSGYIYYLRVLMELKIFDKDYLDCLILNLIDFYRRIAEEQNEMEISTFIYHQLRLLALITVCDDFLHDELMAKNLTEVFKYKSIINELVVLLNNDLAKKNRSEIEEMVNCFMEIINKGIRNG